MAASRPRIPRSLVAPTLAAVALVSWSAASPADAQVAAQVSPAALAFCSSRLPASAAQACATALRYLRAELSGGVWPTGDSAAAFGLSKDQYSWSYAQLGVDPVLCDARMIGDTALIAVQIGQLGFVAAGNETGYWTFAPLTRLDDRGIAVVLQPPVRWSIREYRVLRTSDGWGAYYPPGVQNGPEPLIGVAAAVRHYEGPAPRDFRRQVDEARAALASLPRPACRVSGAAGVGHGT